MTFISYAQNCEDVILSRALKGVEKGFYVDVGAMDPVFDSVTKALYERGWRGINIEPVHQWYEKLALDRPEDINLNLALLDKPSIIHLYEIADTGLSTFDRVLAERHKQKEGYQIRDVATTALTLDIVLEEQPHEDIHFLKVGVEGAALVESFAENLAKCGHTSRPPCLSRRLLSPRARCDTQYKGAPLGCRCTPCEALCYYPLCRYT